MRFKELNSIQAAAISQPWLNDLPNVITKTTLDEGIGSWLSKIMSSDDRAMTNSSKAMQRYIQYFIDEMMQVAAKYRIDLDPDTTDPKLQKLINRHITRSTLQYLPIKALYIFMRGAMQLPESDVQNIFKSFNNLKQNKYLRLDPSLIGRQLNSDRTLQDMWGADKLGANGVPQSRTAERIIQKLISLAAARKMEIDHMRDVSDARDLEQPADQTAQSTSDVSPPISTTASAKFDPRAWTATAKPVDEPTGYTPQTQAKTPVAPLQSIPMKGSTTAKFDPRVWTATASSSKAVQSPKTEPSSQVTPKDIASIPDIKAAGQKQKKTLISKSDLENPEYFKLLAKIQKALDKS